MTLIDNRLTTLGIYPNSLKSDVLLVDQPFGTGHVVRRVIDGAFQRKRLTNFKRQILRHLAQFSSRTHQFLTQRQTQQSARLIRKSFHAQMADQIWPRYYHGKDGVSNSRKN